MGRSAILLTLVLFPGVAFAEDSWRQPGEIKQPKGTWQVPGEIQQPKATWQIPGEIQIPRGIQAIKKEEKSSCESRLLVAADALFEFDSGTLSAEAKQTLNVLIPLIAEKKPRTLILEGHTDSKGSDAYNLELSTRRAEAVRAWLDEQHVTDAAVSTKGYGETRPVAQNVTSDGKDDPIGRQKNRRVEIVLSSCS